jgi:predicted permease
VPGVEHVSLARRVPLGFVGMSSTRVEIDGYEPAADERVILGYNVVGADYARTMGIPIVAGRDFLPSDTASTANVVLVSRAAAERYFAGLNAVGGRVRVSGQWRTVIGVVADVKQGSLTERPRPFMYLPTASRSVGPMVVHVRTAIDPSALAGPVRAAIEAVDSSVPVFDVASLDAHTAAATFQQRLAANLLAVFGGLALLLASVGTYGVLAWIVGQRRREIGLRLAIGASQRAVFRQVLGSGAAIVAAGIVVGVLLAAGASQLLGALLVGVSPVDPATYLAVVAILLAVSLLACAVPARRAATVDPATILRES